MNKKLFNFLNFFMPNNIRETRITIIWGLGLYFLGMIVQRLVDNTLNHIPVMWGWVVFDYVL